MNHLKIEAVTKLTVSYKYTTQNSNCGIITYDNYTQISSVCFNLCMICIKVENNWSKRETSRRISSHISDNLAGQGSVMSRWTRPTVGVH